MLNRYRLDAQQEIGKLKRQLAAVTAERDELQAKRDTEWAQFVRISRDEQIAVLRTKWMNAEYQLDALRKLVGALDRITPKRPMAMTYDKGVEIVNHVQDVLLPAYRATLGAGQDGR